MSNLDPLAALAAQVIANADAAIEAAALDLGAALTELQSQISVGDVIVATVLPPQDGLDRISLLGQTVPAQLPPGINPGESIALQVTGFTNTAVLVTSLGVVDPENPPTAADVPPPAPAAPGAAQTAVLTTRFPIPPSPATTSAIPPATPTGTSAVPSPSTPVSPPREVFVAASVRNAPPIPQVIVSEIQAAPPADLEARIALNRAGSLPPAPRPVVAQPPSAQAPATPPTVARGGRPDVPGRGLTIPPIITPARGTAERAAPLTARITTGTPAPAATSAAAARVATTPEAALLTRLGIPISAVTLAAARGIGTAAQSVTTTYQKLESLLATVPADERTTALRSALAFVAKLDLRNVRALPEQIASFVSNVVDGAESKIAQLVRAWSTGVALAATEPEQGANEGSTSQNAPANAAPANAAPANAALAQNASAQNAQSSVQPEFPPVPSPTVEARAAERMVALDHDVKTAILAMIANPPSGTSPALLTALRAALTATNALQFNVLASRSADANTITIPLPAYFYDGGKPAQLQISRDAPNGKNRMDADNFRVAFILDTKSLGTVAIDVQTVGRNVSVDVKTEASLSAERFRTTLPDLGARLEQLHYRVATMAAGVAAAAPQSEANPQVTTEAGPRSNVDMQA